MRHAGRKLAGDSPFTAKASLIRYWKKQVSGNLPNSFFLNKASPLDAVELASFSKLADQRSLSSQLPEFCKQANLLCFPDVGTSLEKHSKDVNFATYDLQNFTNYGTDRVGGVDSFKNYTNSNFTQVDTFRHYSRDSVRHNDKFTTYVLDANVVDQTFNTYGTKSTDGTGDFSQYGNNTNVPGLTFTSYSDSTNGRTQDFKEYSPNTNVPDQNFTSYGKNGKEATNAFTSYANATNSGDSSFTNYAETAHTGVDNFTSYADKGNAQTNNFKSYARGGDGANETFTSYGADGNGPVSNFKSYSSAGNGATQTFTRYGENTNVPTNDFKSYAVGVSGATETFTGYSFNGNDPADRFKNYGSGGDGTTQTFSSYRDQSNVGDDSFESYADGSKKEKVGFSNYGRSFNEGSDTFKGYAKNSKGQKVDFKTYGVYNNTFKDYAKTGVTFSKYNVTRSPSTAAATTARKGNNRWVEAGKFFREKMLKTGTVMAMPNIKDKMPKRSFLPRAILSKIPFSSSKIDELKKIFHAADDSSLTRMMGNAMRECERAPSPGETKRCAGSGEDMIDFATSVLGRKVAVRTTENTQGSGRNIMIGKVTKINGGRVTKSVSCHQSLYPYLLYYCHSVPKVRVYEADILDPTSKSKINHGVAICHIDTSSWSRNHGAFIALGSGPGKIEVCHWIFENDMTWNISDES